MPGRRWRDPRELNPLGETAPEAGGTAELLEGLVDGSVVDLEGPLGQLHPIVVLGNDLAFDLDDGLERKRLSLDHGRGLIELGLADRIELMLGGSGNERVADQTGGDFGFDPLGLLPGNEEQYKTAELTHGRAAMLAFSAVATQSALPASFGFGQESFPYF